MHRTARVPRLALPAVLVAVVLAVVAIVASTAPAADSEAKAEGTLGVDTSVVCQTIDPQRMFEPTSQIAVKGMYDTLLTFRGQSTTPLPWLAPSLEGSRDAEEVTLH